MHLRIQVSMRGPGTNPSSSPHCRYQGMNVQINGSQMGMVLSPQGAISEEFFFLSLLQWMLLVSNEQRPGMLLNILQPSTTKEYVFLVQYIHNGTVENTCSTSTLVLFLFFWNFTITYGNYSINFQRFPHSVLWLQEAGIIVYSASLLCVSISVVFNILQLQII